MLHDTILKYIALIKSVFNGLSISHKDEHGRYITKSIPMFYGRSEKALIMNGYSLEQVRTGNNHVIPCGYISLDAFTKADDRSTNKNRITRYDDNKFSYNSVPYDFVFTIDVRCRGASEAYQIVEQVAPMFNPTLNLDVWDSLFKEEPTRVPLVLDGIDVTAPDYEESSNNIYVVSLSCTLRGWIYQPVMIGDPINTTILNTSTAIDQDAYISVVNNDQVLETSRLKFNIIDIIKDKDTLEVITDCDEKFVIDYSWSSTAATLSGQGPKVKIEDSDDRFVVEVVITNQFGNFVSLTKTFNKSKYL